MRRIIREDLIQIKRHPILTGFGLLFVALIFYLLVIVPASFSLSAQKAFKEQEEAYARYNPANSGTILPPKRPNGGPDQRVGNEQQAAKNQQTCDDNTDDSYADLCAQWEAVAAVSRGNQIAAASFKLGGLAAALTGIGVILSGLGVAVGALATREATRAVGLMINEQRGFLSVEPTSLRGSPGLSFVNVGDTPVWLRNITAGDKTVFNGVKCLRAGSDDVFPIRSGAENENLELCALFRDGLDEERSISARLVWRDGQWDVDEFHHRQSDER